MTAPTFNGNLAGNANTAGKAATAAVGPAAGNAQSLINFLYEKMSSLYEELSFLCEK